VLPKAKKKPRRPRPMAPHRTRTAFDFDGVAFSFPAITHGVNGKHGHEWAAKECRRDLRRATKAAIAWLGEPCPVFLPAIVTITRVGPGAMDSDGVAYAVKGARDEIAAWLGIDDGDERVEWRTRGAVGPYEVRVEIGHRSVCGSCGQTATSTMFRPRPDGAAK
jgi:hypothetical protein